MVPHRMMLNPQHISALPPEILVNIFTCLHGKQLIKCRQVCKQWKALIDELTNDNHLWLDYCEEEYSGNYLENKDRVSEAGLTWYSVYKSLSLWPRISKAKEIMNEFACPISSHDEILGFQMLKNGEIGVHRRHGIFYYRMETFREKQNYSISGNYSRYAENDDCIILLDYHLQLYIVRKIIQSPTCVKSVTFDYVKTFLLIDRTVYFTNVNNELCACNLDDNQLKNQLMVKGGKPIICLGYKNDVLYAVTFDCHIYAVEKNEVSIVNHITYHTNAIHILNRYNILENMDWTVYKQWMQRLKKSPEGPHEITTIRAYGDIYLVGCNWSELLIFYKPFYKGELDFFNVKPIKRYNLMGNNRQCKSVNMSPIKKVDVRESLDGHQILIGLSNKILVIDFKHRFKNCAVTPVKTRPKKKSENVVKLY